MYVAVVVNFRGLRFLSELASRPADDGRMDTNDLRSRLEHGRQRFLAYAIEHSFQIGRRTPEDFIRHFPPRTIMEALSMRPDLRAGILVPTTGLKHRIALKKSWQSAGDDLQSALDEGETKPHQIVEAFSPDDRVLYLQDKKLWAFIIEGAFWKVTPKEDKAAFAMAQQHVAYLLDRALLDGLITPRDVVDGIGVSELCNRLPRSEMASLFTAALDGGRKGSAFTDRDLLTTLPPSTLVQHVPLPHIYESVINTRIANVHGYLPTEEKQEKKEDKPAAQAEPPGVLIGAPAEAKKDAPTEAPALEVNIEVKPEPKGNGSRRRSKPPPSAETEGTVEEDGNTEWIDIPESQH